MTRRAGIMAALMWGVAKAAQLIPSLRDGQAQTVEVDTGLIGIVGVKTEQTTVLELILRDDGSVVANPTVLRIKVDGGGEPDAFEIRFNDLVARVSMREVMEALGAVRERKP